MEEKESSEILTPMSELDNITFNNLVCLYFFNGLLDPTKIQENLESTVKDIPLLSSVIVKRDDGMFFKHVSPSNVTFTVKKDVPDEIYDYYKPDEEDGILNFEEGCKFYEYIDSVQSNRNPMVPILSSPLMKLTLLNTRDTKKCILSVSMSHGLADAHTLVWVMQRLSLGKERFKALHGFDTFDISRKYMTPPPATDGNDDEFIKNVKAEHMEILKCFHPFNKEYLTPEEKGFRMGADVVQKMVHFSPERIRQLKSMVKSPKKFSTNDCICAHMWKLFASIGDHYKKKPGQILPFRLILNARDRVPNISKNYIGNVAVALNMDASKESILLSDNYTELVLKIRGLVDSMDDDLFRAILYFTKKYRPLWSVGAFSRKTSITLDDWRLIDFLKPGSFGAPDVKCERALLNPPAVKFFTSQFWFVHLDDDDGGVKGGVNVQTNLEKVHWDMIKEAKIRDLSDPDVLDKICKVFE